MKYAYKASIMLVILLMTGCTSLSTANSDRWFEHELPPSRVNYSGDDLMEIKLADGATCYVFYDEEIIDDNAFYYSLLMQDFGWYRDGEGWVGSASYVKYPKSGYMYINPKRQVAIYFYPKGTYDAFKLEIETNTNSN